MLFINGKLLLNPDHSDKITYLGKTLQPDGFHLSGTQLPVSMNDSLRKWLTPYNINLPQIQTLSLNLRGTKIINHSSGFFVIPQMELYVKTAHSFDIEKLLSDKKLQTYFDYEIDSNCIRFQDERLFFDQLTPTEFYIGVTPKPKWTKHSGKELLIVKGNLKPLMKIEGGGLMTSFLEMIPEYRASKQLSDHIDRFELTMRRTGNKHALLQGKMVFGDDYHPMNEIIKFLLTGEFVQ